MSNYALKQWWRLSTHLLSPGIRLSSSTISTYLEQLPREELVTKFKSKLRGREFLPGSSCMAFPEFLAEPRDLFPLGVRVKNPDQSSLTELTAKCMDYMEENFPRSPAIVFRGLPAKTAQDFSIIARAIPHKRISHFTGTGIRSVIDEDVGTYTASERPKEHTIELHNEMSYNEYFPSRVFFFCVKEPADGCGGETPLVKNSELQCRLDLDVMRKFDEKNVIYERYMKSTHQCKSPGMYTTWQQFFNTESREIVEELAKQQGLDIRWDPSGDLYLWQCRPAFITHPVSGERIFFNQATNHHNSVHKVAPEFVSVDIPDEKLPYHSYYGDGREIEPEVVQHIRATTWACAVGFQWKCGDLLALDNLAVQHGRIGFTGQREMLAYLASERFRKN